MSSPSSPFEGPSLVLLALGAALIVVMLAWAYWPAAQERLERIRRRRRRGG